MSQVSRHGFLKGMGMAGLVSAGMFLASDMVGGPSRVRAQNSLRLGRVLITQAGVVNFHTYVASEASFLVLQPQLR